MMKRTCVTSFNKTAKVLRPISASKPSPASAKAKSSPISASRRNVQPAPSKVSSAVSQVTSAAKPTSVQVGKMVKSPDASIAAAVTKLPEASQQPAPWNNRRSAEEINAIRQKHQNPVHKHFYKDPIMLVTAKNQYVWDSEGQRYLDMYTGVSSVSVGHSNDECIEAVTEQLNRMQHVTPLYNEPSNYEFMERLNKHLPQDKDWVFHFTSSGSEANDFATYLARSYTKNNMMVCLQNGYHGLTAAPHSFVTSPGWRNHVAPAIPTVKTPAPTPYRGIFGTDLDEYINYLEKQVDAETGGHVAGFIAERIQGVNGLHPLLDGYLPKAYDVIRKRGGVVISDEVQTGFTRTGEAFWGWEMDGACPDIITCAKSLSNGLPLGLCITTREIANSVNHAFFNTFGGNPLSTAHANAALKQIEEKDYLSHNKKIGNRLMDGAKKLAEKYEVIGDVRGKGGMTGIEFVHDRDNKKTPMTAAEFNPIMEELRERRILVGRGGTGNTMRIQGPYCMTEEDIDYFLYSLEETLSMLHPAQ